MEIELDAPQDPTQRRERWIVAGLAAFAALRVFVFAAAFPFFHNVDEHMHVDLVLKYARGFLPGPEDAHFEADTARVAGRPRPLHEGTAHSGCRLHPYVLRGTSTTYQSPRASTARRHHGLAPYNSSAETNRPGTPLAKARFSCASAIAGLL